MNNEKALNMFIVAEQFRVVGKLPSFVKREGLFAAMPLVGTAQMVCMAFSLELYFKCLITIGNKQFRRAHDLCELFDLIDEQIQANIKQYVGANSANVKSYVERAYKEEGTPIPNTDFNFLLTASKDAFIALRYVYEDGAASNTGWLGDVIVEGARVAILGMYPDWEYAEQKSLLPETSFQQPTSPTR